MVWKPPSSNVEWKSWGLYDPLWGVASWEGKQKDGKHPWELADFYETGRCDWSDFLEHWKRYGLDADTCLEIGCGAGRITRYLADSFNKVISVDVSAEMLALANRQIESANVNFQLIDGTQLPFSDNSMTAVFSTHVFQHFDHLEYASAYFSEVARVLRSGGTLMIHIPVFQWHPRTPNLMKILFFARSKYDDLTIWIRRYLLHLGWIQRPFMRYLAYPISYLYTELPAIGLTDIEISIFTVSSNGDPHPFVLARK